MIARQRIESLCCHRLPTGIDVAGILFCFGYEPVKVGCTANVLPFDIKAVLGAWTPSDAPVLNLLSRSGSHFT